MALRSRREVQTEDWWKDGAEMSELKMARDGRTAFYDSEAGSIHVYVGANPRKQCARHIYSPLGNGHSVPGQCSKGGRHEHNGFLFCAIHYPPNVAERDKARRARWDAESKANVARWAQEEEDRKLRDRCLDAIKQIAAGHNDPRALAMEVLNADGASPTPGKGQEHMK